MTVKHFSRWLSPPPPRLCSFAISGPRVRRHATFPGMLAATDAVLSAQDFDGRVKCVQIACS